jgi:hypothetical protein
MRRWLVGSGAAGLVTVWVILFLADCFWADRRRTWRFFFDSPRRGLLVLPGYSGVASVLELGREPRDSRGKASEGELSATLRC